MMRSFRRSRILQRFSDEQLARLALRGLIYEQDGVLLPAVSGGQDSYTKLLLHCDGTDASTTFTDSSDSLHTVTANGNAQIDTAQSVFGGASGLFDGSGDRLQTADSANWSLGSGDFTFDWRVRFVATGPSNTVFFAQADEASTDLAFDIWFNGTSNILQVYISTNGTTWGTTYGFAWTPSTSTWYHVAVARDGSNLRAFVDGTQIGITETISATLRDSGQPLYIGSYVEASPTSSLNGWLDEVRISKGIARWTANFTSPTAPYGFVPQISFIL